MAHRPPTIGAGNAAAGNAAAAAEGNGSVATTVDEPEEADDAATGGSEGRHERVAPPDERPSTPAEAFIGRREQLELFRRLAGIGDSDAAADRLQVFLICGSDGTGKRELLNEFRRQCEQREPPSCAPVINLGEPRQIDDLMEEIAVGLKAKPEVFERFHKTLRAHRDAVEGKRSALVQASEGLRTAGRAANEVVPTVATGVTKGLGELIHHGAEKIEASQRARSVRDDFVNGLVELGQRSSHAPPVLLFCDVDRWADDPTVVWLRRSLLPKLAGAPVLVVATAQVADKVEDLASHGIVQRLDRFPDAEAREYVERVLRVPLDTRLARDILTDSDGFPERLGRYKAYFEQFPEAYGGDGLTDDARSFAAGGSVLQFLTRWDSALPRRLVLHASPLRWFNATLLRATASAVGLVHEGDTATDPVAALLDPATRPPWIRNVGAGWGLDEASRRRAFVDEVRRFDPDSYRKVHTLAARYHHTRLLALERREDEPEGGSFVHYVPTATPTTRFENPEYVAELAELLYHSLALAPDHGFRLAAEHAAGALFYGEHGHAARLLDLGPELELPKRYDVYLRQLAELAAAIGAGRQNEVLGLLEQLDVAGAPSDMVAGVLSFLRGATSAKLGFFQGEVVRHLERAEQLFAGLSETQIRARRMRFSSLVWLARARVGQDPSSAAVLQDLEAAERLANDLGEPELRPELHRTRALVLLARDEIDGARREWGQALICLRRLGAPRDVARVLQDRAGLLDRTGDTPGARRDLLSARELYKQLESSEGEAETAVALMEVELRNGDLDGAQALREEVLAMRPRDPHLRNSIGLAFHRCGKYPEAVKEYDAALELDPLPLFYANRALTRWAWGDRARAIEDGTRAFDLAPTNVERGLWLAELKRQTDDWVGAAEVAQRVAGTALEAARAEATSGGAAAGSGVPPALGVCVSQLLELLDSTAAAELLRHCVELFPADPEFHFLLGMALREDPDAGKSADRELLRAWQLAADAQADPCALARYLTARADLLAQTRRWEQAERIANEAVELCPGNVEAHELKARIQRVGRRDLWERDDGEVWPFAAPIRIEIAADLEPRVSADELTERLLPRFRAHVQKRSGVELPAIAIRDRSELAAGTVRIVLHDVPRSEFRLLGAHLAAATPEGCRALTGATLASAARPWDGAHATWVGEGSCSELLKAGIQVWDAHGVILATLDHAVEERLESFVGFSYTAARAQERGLELGSEELSRLTALFSALLAAGVTIEDFETIERELRGLDPGKEPGGLVAELGGRLSGLGTERTGPEHYALGTPASATAGEEGSVVLVRAKASDLDPVKLRAVLEGIIDLACARLTLPHPALELEIADDLPEDEYEVHVAGVPRIAGSVRSFEADRRLTHGSSASRGRTGLPPAPDPGQATPSPERSIALALEEAIWDDPSLLLQVPAAERLIASVIPRRTGDRDPLEPWSLAFREVAAQRVPLHGVDDLEAARRVVSTVHPALGERPGSLVERHESAPERPIPDNLPLGVRDHIEINAEGRADVVRVRAHVRHPRPEHLRVRLAAPDGTSATLEDRSAGRSEDLLLDYDSITKSALERLVGHPAAGTWTLHVQDLEPEAVGTLMSWSLEVEIGCDSAESSTLTRTPDPLAPAAPSASSRAIEHVTYSERIAEELRPYEITVRVGERLDAAVRSGEAAGSGRSFLEGVAERFFLESGLRLGRGFSLEVAPLGPWQYEIEINDLPRSCGTAPEDRPIEALGDDLLGCLREAAHELLGVGWTERYLEHLSVLSPPLVAAVRRRYTVEIVCWLFGRLVADGFSLRDDRILDCLLEFEAPVEDLAALWRHTRLRLGDSLAFRLRGDGGTVDLIELDAGSESSLRSSIATEGGALAGYSTTAGLALLRQLRSFVEPRAKPPMLVTAPDLRAHVGRIVAAQFPTVPVLARDELRPEMETELVGRIVIERRPGAPVGQPQQ